MYQTIFQRNRKCYQNINLYKTMISLNMFQYKKSDTWIVCINF